MLTAKGVRVAFLAYTEMTNGIPFPHPWSVNLARAPRSAPTRAAPGAAAPRWSSSTSTGATSTSGAERFQRRLARRLTRPARHRDRRPARPCRPADPRSTAASSSSARATSLSNQTAACCPPATQDGLIALLRLTVDEGPRRGLGSRLRADLGPPPRLRRTARRGRPASPPRVRSRAEGFTPPHRHRRRPRTRGQTGVRRLRPVSGFDDPRLFATSFGGISWLAWMTLSGSYFDLTSRRRR